MLLLTTLMNVIIKDVLIGDANTGWTVHQVAAIIMR